MKKFSALTLGLAMVLGTAFAAQKPAAKADEKAPADATATTKVKKHHRKHKKSTKEAGAAAKTMAAPPAPTK